MGSRLYCLLIINAKAEANSDVYEARDKRNSKYLLGLPTRANDDSLNDSEPKLESLYHRNSQGMTDGLYTISQTTDRETTRWETVHSLLHARTTAVIL